MHRTLKKALKYLSERSLAFLEFVYKRRTHYPSLSESDYLKRFGIEEIGGSYKVVNEQRLEKAYSKAWENRNYEIDKFWTRAAYFWGFIVLIFGCYISLLTSEHSQKALDMRLDLYLILLGFLFSLSWYLVILGSKSWQKNWEAHIDRLEEYVSGPIYKTIYYSGKRFYSVSKLNEVMAMVVFGVWCGLFGRYVYTQFSFTINSKKIDFEASISILLTFVFASALRFGYCLGDYKSDKNELFDRWDW